eukprot:416582-Prorocentrum_minimum.AAC.3
MINKGVVEPTVTMATSGVMSHSGEGSDEGGPTVSHSKRAIENCKRLLPPCKSKGGGTKGGKKTKTAGGQGGGGQDGGGDRSGLQQAVKFDSNTCDLRGMRVGVTDVKCKCKM